MQIFKIVGVDLFSYIHIDGPKFIMDVVLTTRETTNLPPVLADWRLALTYLASAGTQGKQLPIVKVVEFFHTTPGRQTRLHFDQNSAGAGGGNVAT
jgi:hypothetical protein